MSLDSSGSEREVKFLLWSKNDGAAKEEVTLDAEDALVAWQETVVKIKENIFTKREQNESYRALKSDLEYNENINPCRLL